MIHDRDPSVAESQAWCVRGARATDDKAKRPERKRRKGTPSDLLLQPTHRMSQHAARIFTR